MIAELLVGYAVGKSGRTIVMADGKKKFDTYEDFVEHMTILLSHNTYQEGTTTDRIQCFVREISTKLDAGSIMWNNNDGWMMAVKSSQPDPFFNKGFVFSDPQAWGILGLTDKQIHVLYSCVHSILLTGARDYDEWKIKTEMNKKLSDEKIAQEVNQGCLPILAFLAAGTVLYFGFDFITHHKNYPIKKYEIETAYNNFWQPVTRTPTAMPTKTPTAIVPTAIVQTAIVQTETPTAIVPTAIPDKWLNIEWNTDSRSQFNNHIQIMIRILSVIEIKDSDYDRNICKNPVPEGAKGILVNIEAKNVGEDNVAFPSDFHLNDKYSKKSDNIGFCLKKSTIKYPSSLSSAYPGVSSSYATLRFEVPVAFDMETAFMSIRMYANSQIKSFHFYQ